MNRRFLLDTHVFLWWQMGSSELTDDAEEAIATADLVFVSAASAWEVAIKKALGKLRLELSFEGGVESSGFEKLAVDFVHAERAGSLPSHHRDPFDRMLVAQAQEEGLTLVTHDRRLELYDVPFLWV
jgi:PIN domain nuclease of toxin-antitoxin system